MPDKTLVCRECNTQFTFTEGEQEFFKTKGFSEPIRCNDCRARRKAEKMTGGGSSFGGGRRSRDW
ncbi:MAG TPA: zinc-ribbon domain-containing protein [Armatimonadota bacterium]|nr:zinc-ribbon domain-containing protein [Armatimonadota bacterium]